MSPRLTSSVLSSTDIEDLTLLIDQIDEQERKDSLEAKQVANQRRANRWQQSRKEWHPGKGRSIYRPYEQVSGRLDKGSGC